MGRVIPITEQFQHFGEDGKESFEGDLYGKTKLAWKQFLEEASRKERDRPLGVQDYERAGQREYRNGCYRRRFVTVFGTRVLRVARTRGKSFLPPGAGALSTPGQRREAAVPGSVLARGLDPTGGAGGSDSHRRGGERADGLEVESQAGSAGEGISRGGAQG